MYQGVSRRLRSPGGSPPRSDRIDRPEPFTTSNAGQPVKPLPRRCHGMKLAEPQDTRAISRIPRYIGPPTFGLGCPGITGAAGAIVVVRSAENIEYTFR
jgi:hypothetical protein